MEQLRDLNPAQREAVQTLRGPLLVLAGAGTGKTRVITFRIAELVRTGTPPERILSVTFTNKAAREMLDRTRLLLGKSHKKNPVVSTFHSHCVRILRQDIDKLGYPPGFVIYDRGDQESAARKTLRDIRLSEKSLRPADLLSQISIWKTAGIVPGRAIDVATNDLEYLAAAAFRRYQAELRASGGVDFDDLLLLTNQLFAEFPDVLARHQRRFDFVQIDEYQDTNRAQFELVEALVRPHQSLCVVGDDDQAIYGWRGADVEHILNFQKHFPAAKVIRLEHNYRSTRQILEIANRLVGHNLSRHQKTLLPHRADGSEVRMLEYPDDTLEAEAVVREIKYLVEHKHVPAGDIAVLFRTNEQPRLFETELRRARLRYVLIGSQSFFDRREVRDMLAYLKCIAHPGDEVSMLRIINTPARGIGTTTVEKVLAGAVASKRSLWDVVPEALRSGEITEKAANALGAFRDLVARYRARFIESPRTLERVLVDLIEEIDYASEIRKQYKEPQQQTARLAVLDQFVDSLRDYLGRTRNPTLAGFLDETALKNRDEEPDTEDQLSNDAVKLMTLHSAKGLEFPRVYLVGMEDGILPHHRSIDGSASAVAEERRLAYVGVTRARDVLTLTRAANRRKWGKLRPSIPSRFLAEMSGIPSPGFAGEGQG